MSDTEIVLSQGTKIDLIGIAQDIDHFSDAMDVSDTDDETLVKLVDDASSVFESAAKLHRKLCEDTKTRQSFWQRFIRYEGCEKMMPLIETLADKQGIASSGDAQFKVIPWTGYEFKMRDFPNRYLLRCFGEQDRDRDVCLAENSLQPFDSKCSGILAERADIEVMAAEQRCSVFEFLNTQVDERLEFIIAFHLV